MHAWISVHIVSGILRGDLRHICHKSWPRIAKSREKATRIISIASFSAKNPNVVTAKTLVELIDRVWRHRTLADCFGKSNSLCEQRLGPYLQQLFKRQWDSSRRTRYLKDEA